MRFITITAVILVLLAGLLLAAVPGLVKQLV